MKAIEHKWGSDLCEQHRRIKEAFVHGRVTPARGPVIFSEDQLARLQQVRGTVTGSGSSANTNTSTWSGLKLEGGLATRCPPRPRNGNPSSLESPTTSRCGSAAPATTPLSWSCSPTSIGRVSVSVTGSPSDEADGYEDIWLVEAVETGGLGRLMGRHPHPDRDGIVWTDW